VIDSRILRKGERGFQPFFLHYCRSRAIARVAAPFIVAKGGDLLFAFSGLQEYRVVTCVVTPFSSRVAKCKCQSFIKADRCTNNIPKPEYRGKN
jgi:hypothetical protein